MPSFTAAAPDRAVVISARLNGSRSGSHAGAVAPVLAVVALSDSCSQLWPELAEDCGLELVVAAHLESSQHLPEAIRILSAAGAEYLLDAALKDLTGAPVAVVTTVTDHRVAVDAMRLGATEYFVLPADLEALRGWVAERAEIMRARLDRIQFTNRERARYRFDEILGESAALRQALDRTARVIPAGNATLLIVGETGTGKELLARAVHYNGPRREGPFVDINCSAIPEHLLETELFGHEKGAFTGAVASKAGLLEVAHGGTVLLDEIGHLPLSLQGKLLRVLEERMVRRVGATRAVPIDVRIIAATNVDLASAVAEKRFREDLYYRLNVVQLQLPPLRFRRGDILQLARHFLDRFAAEYDRPSPILTRAAEQILLDGAWRGNVRELRNAMERAVVLADDNVIDASDVAYNEETLPRETTAGLHFPATLDEITRSAAHAMVQLYGGNKSVAARRLRISRSRLDRLLKLTLDQTAEQQGEY